MLAQRPFADEMSLVRASDQVWFALSETDWDEAFQSHPRIGEPHAPGGAPARSTTWSLQEQTCARTGSDDVKIALARANREYEKRFGRVFIICATGKSAPEILANLERRMKNDTETELRQAADEQRQIIRIRLKKWLGI